MRSTRDRIVAIIADIAERKGVVVTTVPDEADLYRGGVGLDSLDTAEFSVLLEEEFGHDPYSRGTFPRTLAETLVYYERSTAP
ncbi:MAG: acyl carrier protein [Bryobacteraceae bacterium]